LRRDRLPDPVAAPRPWPFSTVLWKGRGRSRARGEGKRPGRGLAQQRLVRKSFAITEWFVTGSTEWRETSQIPITLLSKPGPVAGEEIGQNGTRKSCPSAIPGWPLLRACGDAVCLVHLPDEGPGRAASGVLQKHPLGRWVMSSALAARSAWSPRYRADYDLLLVLSAGRPYRQAEPPPRGWSQPAARGGVFTVPGELHRSA
jgi:hypothetical protein